VSDLDSLRGKFVEGYIHTNSGIHAYPLDLKPEQVNINDIAHALGHQCRFSGHCDWFYSVGQHSYYVSVIIEQLGGTPMDRLCGLLHDATEAYLVDLPSPIKWQLPEYKIAEDKAMEAICTHFNLPKNPFGEGFTGERTMAAQNTWALVKQADLIALATEARDLMKNPPWGKNLGRGIEPMDWKIDRWKIHDSASVFRAQYFALVEEITGNSGRIWIDRIKKVGKRFDPRQPRAQMTKLQDSLMPSLHAAAKGL